MTDLVTLQAFNILSAIIEQRHQPGVKVQCKVLEVRNIDASVLLCLLSLCVDVFLRCRY